MRHAFYLAACYLSFHRARSLTLIACLSLMAALPVGLHQMLEEGQQQMRARALSTPLLLTPSGSAVDTTLAVLNFSGRDLPTVSIGTLNALQDTGWGMTLPIFSRFKVQGQALIGVTLDYFDFRGLQLAAGDTLTLLGDCVLGAEAARALNRRIGDVLLTAPENLFDLAGVFPLKLHVAGVLAPSGTADDAAIFIDLKTSWILEGLGHGHSAPSKPGESTAGLSEARLRTYTEITPDNIDSFHFHGDPNQYPITAGIIVPRDPRSSTLIKGRFVDQQSPVRLIEPRLVVQELMDSFFRITRLFDGVILAVSAATLLALGLVFSLSLRLRRREMETSRHIGCSRLFGVKLVLAELVLLLLAAGLVSFGLITLFDGLCSGWVRMMWWPQGGGDD